MTGNTNYTDALLEAMRDDIKVILEVVAPLRRELAEVKQLTDRIPNIEADVKMLRQALTDTNKDLRDHERRITHLEAVAA